MSDMVYGNTGRRDEALNIDMEQSLFQKLQGVAFVPKFKALLSDTLQDVDKNFIYIGCVTDKSGSFTVYGYNSKLESDSRGGDYGHYVAKIADVKTADLKFEDIKFLNEDGFVEYANYNVVNTEKMFSVTPEILEADVNAKKKIINNLLECFMKVRKRKNVSFSAPECEIDKFNLRAIYVLEDIIKYLPYCMRKNVSFVSHVSSNSKLPDTINLAAYENGSQASPRDCINLEQTDALGSDATFYGYVEKVFAMNDTERTVFFDGLYKELEVPAIKAGVDLKSDMYLLDVNTKELWLNGDSDMAVSSIFASVDDVLKIYPDYREIASNRLAKESVSVEKYIHLCVDTASNIDDIKLIYNNMCALFSICNIEMSDELIGILKNRINLFLGNAEGFDDFVNMADGIVGINPILLDRNLSETKISNFMYMQSDIAGIFRIYLKLKEKSYIDRVILNEGLSSSTERLILNGTESYELGKDKLSYLENTIGEFKKAYVYEDGYSIVEEAFNKYRSEFVSRATEEALSNGEKIISRIELEIDGYSTIFDIKNQIKLLSEIDVIRDVNLKNRTSNIYRKLSKKAFECFNEIKPKYYDFVKIIDELNVATSILNKNKIYDNDYIGYDKNNEIFIYDGLHRFVSMMNKLIKNLVNFDELEDVIVAYEICKGDIQNNEVNIAGLYKKFGYFVVSSWCVKHKKQANASRYKKAVKRIKKTHDKMISVSTDSMFDDIFDTVKSYNSSNKKKTIIISLVSGICLLLIIGAVSCFFIFDSDDAQDDISEQNITDTLDDTGDEADIENDDGVIDSDFEENADRFNTEADTPQEDNDASDDKNKAPEEDIKGDKEMKEEAKEDKDTDESPVGPEEKNEEPIIEDEQSSRPLPKENASEQTDVTGTEG